jgi:hypothetical protein
VSSPVGASGTRPSSWFRSEPWAALGLPKAVSGQLTYYYWKPASLDGPVIAVGVDRTFLSTLFNTCSEAGSITNSFGRHNEEYGAPLTVCRQPKLPLDELWPRLKAFR